MDDFEKAKEQLGPAPDKSKRLDPYTAKLVLIYKLYKEGYSVKDIAFHTKVKINTIYSALTQIKRAFILAEELKEFRDK